MATGVQSKILKSAITKIIFPFNAMWNCLCWSERCTLTISHLVFFSRSSKRSIFQPTDIPFKWAYTPFFSFIWKWRSSAFLLKTSLALDTKGKESMGLAVWCESCSAQGYEKLQASIMFREPRKWQVWHSARFAVRIMRHLSGSMTTRSSRRRNEGRHLQRLAQTVPRKRGRKVICGSSGLCFSPYVCFMKSGDDRQDPLRSEPYIIW